MHPGIEPHSEPLPDRRTVTLEFYATESRPLVRFSVVISRCHLGRRRGDRLVIGSIRRSTIMGAMWTSLVVEGHPMPDPVPGLTTAAPGVQVDALVFQGSP